MLNSVPDSAIKHACAQVPAAPLSHVRTSPRVMRLTPQHDAHAANAAFVLICLALEGHSEVQVPDCCPSGLR